MAGGLGGLGGFGSVLGALGQSLLTSPRENPFQGLPQALQASAKDREHQAALLAMSTVAEKLGVPKELAASPEAMKLFIDHINATKLNQLRQQAAQGTSLVPPSEDAGSQPAMSVPGLQGSSGISTTFNVAGGGVPGGGMDGPGGLGGVASAASNTGLRAAVTRGRGSAPSARNLPGPETAQAIAASAQRLGVSPVDLATVISYESAGTFSPSKYGGAGGKYLGLIQFGPTEQKQFGANPNQTVEEQLQAAERYLTARGFKPGMGILDLYSTINAGRPGRYNASDAGNGGAPGTVADKVQYQMGPHRARALAMFNALGAQGGPQVAGVGAPAQTAAGDIPLPPPRPTQLASTDPNMPLPSTAMQRVQDEARARGIGQGGPDTGQAGPGIGQGGPDIGQSGAPLNQVAAGRGRGLSVPIPAQTNIPIPAQTNIPATSAAPAPVTSPPVGAGNNRTKAWAQGELQRGMNILAASNGDPVLMKQAEIIIQAARKYVEPSDVAKRIAEAGLTGTPVGRALNAGLPATAVEQLTEQLIPGYVSPSTLEQKKYRSAEEQRAWEHSKAEREARIAEQQRQYLNQFGERKFTHELTKDALDLNLRTTGAQLEQNKFDYERYKTDRDYRQRVDQALVQQNFERQRLGYEGQRVGLEGEKFANTKTQQGIENQRAQEALQQQRDIATESHGIALMTPEEKAGAALNAPARAPNIRAGQEAKTAQAAAEAGARDLAAARSRFGAEATASAQASEGLLASVNKAEQHLDIVTKLGGYGPFNAIPGSRALNAIIPDIPGLKPGHTAEIERQQFDQAIASLGAAKAAAVNKSQGGGNMSSTEQVLARMDLPTLTAADPKVAKGAFQKLREDIGRAQALDRRFGIFEGQQQTQQGAPAAAPRDAAPTAPIRDGATAINPKTGKRIILMNGKWVDAGGAL